MTGIATPAAPPARAGRALDQSLARGLRAFAANPLLLLAPLASGLASLLAAGLGLLLVLAPLGLFSARGLHALRRLRGPFGPGELERLVGLLVESPLAVLLGLLVAFVLGGFVLLLAAFLRGGQMAVLLEADRRAPERAARAAFRVEGAWAVFREAGGRHLMRFFWLLNLYGLVLGLLFVLFLVPLAALALGVARGQLLLPLVLTLLAIPFLAAGAVATRIVYVAAGRAIVVSETGALDAVARGLTRITETLGRTLGLYGITLAAGLVLSLVLSIPRLTLFVVGGAGRDAVAVLLVTFVLMGIEMAGLAAYDIFTNGAFLALWGEPAAPWASPPPVSFPPPGVLAPVPAAPADGEDLAEGLA